MFECPPRIAESIILLFQHVYDIGKCWEARWSPAPMRFWFRGNDDASYSLDPGLLRPPYINEHLENLEYSISNDFRIRGRPYLPSAIQSDWEQMFLMQHYGFPTRLLDWSESLAAAAYFATRDINSSADGAVWVLAPQWLCLRAHNEHATHVGANHPWLRPYALRHQQSDVEAFNKLPPLPLLPDFLDRRIIAQRGRFTIHTFKLGAFESLASEDRALNGDACFLHKIRIPGPVKATIRQQTHIFGGACEDTMFPDLEGLSRGMRWEALERSMSAAQQSVPADRPSAASRRPGDG